MSYQPTPPTNVRIEFDDGRTVPVELIYAGRRKGCHEWISAVIYGQPVRQMFADCLPARTVIIIRAEQVPS